MYNVVGMCSFLLFVGDFRDLSAKFAIAIYPREGTKTRCGCNTGNKRFSLQFIPARGRKPAGLSNGALGKWIAIYPREGTKTYQKSITIMPQPLQFIPARGRKPPRVYGPSARGLHCNLSPRGDENLLPAACTVKRPLLLQFIPARGRKLVLSSFAIGFRQLQFIPARGRKLYSLSRFSQLTGLQFIPARGRKPSEL